MFLKTRAKSFWRLENLEILEMKRKCACSFHLFPLLIAINLLLQLLLLHIVDVCAILQEFKVMYITFPHSNCSYQS